MSASSFYFGFNYKVGDVYTQYSGEELYKNLSFKALAKVSEKPNQSMGFGVGYHVTESFEIFVARVWTEDDGSVPGAKLGYTPATTYGVSFNLTKALQWIQGSM